MEKSTQYLIFEKFFYKFLRLSYKLHLLEKRNDDYSKSMLNLQDQMLKMQGDIMFPKQFVIEPCVSEEEILRQLNENYKKIKSAKCEDFYFFDQIGLYGPSIFNIKQTNTAKTKEQRESFLGKLNNFESNRFYIDLYDLLDRLLLKGFDLEEMKVILGRDFEQDFQLYKYIPLATKSYSFEAMRNAIIDVHKELRNHFSEIGVQHLKTESGMGLIVNSKRTRPMVGKALVANNKALSFNFNGVLKRMNEERIRELSHHISKKDVTMKQFESYLNQMCNTTGSGNHNIEMDNFIAILCYTGLPNKNFDKDDPEIDRVTFISDMKELLNRYHLI